MHRFKLSCWDQPNIVEWTTIVSKVSITKEGQYYLILEDNYIYPGGGGAPADEVTINGENPVLSVGTLQGEIIINTGKKEFRVGDKIKLKIESGLRNKVIRAHTFQHLLSEAFNRENIKTIKADFTEDVPYLKVTPSPSKLQVQAAFNSAQKWINEGLSIRFKYLHLGDVQKLETPNSSVPSDDAILYRVMNVGNITNNICGGLHVENTSHIGTGLCESVIIKGSQSTIRFLCGQQALSSIVSKSVELAHAKMTIGAKSDEDYFHKIVKTGKKSSALIEQNALLEKEILNNSFNILKSKIVEKDSNTYLLSWLPISHKNIKSMMQSIYKWPKSIGLIILGCKDKFRNSTTLIIGGIQTKDKTRIEKILHSYGLIGRGSSFTTVHTQVLLPDYMLDEIANSLLLEYTES